MANTTRKVMVLQMVMQLFHKWIDCSQNLKVSGNGEKSKRTFGSPGCQFSEARSRVERKAIKELEEWYARQDEQLQKTKANNRAAEEAFVNDIDESSPGTEWERVARLCDFNPKSSKQAKDVSRMRSVLISSSRPLVH